MLAAILRFWNLPQNGWGSPYYAAAVRSMRGSLSNFAFAAYDPAGFLSVDKPPLALWLQTLSSLLLGYHGLALLLPEAIAGVLSVLVIYRLVRRSFGETAGFTAGLFLTSTPITVAVDRLNLPDGPLTLTLLCASAVLLRAIRTGRVGALFACALLLGLGFNIKMWESLILAPFFGLIYLLCATDSLQRRLVRLLAAGIVLTAVAFSWVLFVDSVPPSQRPYVGGSRNNSAMDLIFVYNGWDRLTGGKDQMSGKWLEPGGPLEYMGATPGFYAGAPGPFRLMGKALGPQVMWWFGLCLTGLVYLGWRWRDFGRERRAAILLWISWVVGFGVVFSVAGGTVHPYYVSVLAPAVAALGGIAVGEAWRHREEPRLFLPTALIVGALLQAFLLRDFVSTHMILLTGPLVAVVAGSLTLWRRQARAFTVLALCGLCLCPLYWCWTAVAVPGNGLTPSSGPEIAAGGWRNPPPQMPVGFTRKLVSFLEKERRNERFVLATGGVYNASPIIVETGLPVMALGGFMGSDPIVTPQQLIEYFQRGELRFFLIRFGDALPGNTYLPPLTVWVQEHCRWVDPEAWGEYYPGYGMEYMYLYDCQ